MAERRMAERRMAPRGRLRNGWLVASVLLVGSPVSQAQELPPALHVNPLVRDLLRRTSQVLLDGETVYLATTAGVVTAQVKDPARPAYIALWSLPDAVNDLARSDGRLAAALGPSGVAIGSADAAGPGGSVRVRLAGAAMGLAMEPPWLLVAGGTAGVQLVDLSDPSRPRQAAHRQTPGYARHLVLYQQRFVYVADGSGGLRIFELNATHGTLAEAGALSVGGPVRHLSLRGDRLAAACGPAGTVLLSVKNPRIPVVLGKVATEDSARGAALEADLLAVADGTAGLSLWDITSPAAPRLTCRYRPARPVNRVVLSRDLALLANDHDGLTLLRIRPACASGRREPGAPELVGSLPPRGENP